MIKKSFYLLVLLSGLACAQFAPKITVSPLDYDMGDIKQGDVITKIYVITNDGNDVLKITDVRASCGCTAVKPEKNELKPNEKTDLKVTFNSEGKMGKQNKSVYIESNDPANPSFKLTFTANILKNEQTEIITKSPKLSFKETQHDFGKIDEGKLGEYIFKFSNTGGTTLEIKDVKTSCGCTAALVSSKKIEPGKEGTLRVELDTSNREGKMTRSITITSNDPNEPSKTLTISAEVIKKG